MGGTCLFCLTPMLASMESPQQPVYGWSRSADVAVLIPCAAVLGVVSLADVSALTWVVSLLNRSVTADWQPPWLTCMTPFVSWTLLCWLASAVNWCCSARCASGFAERQHPRESRAPIGYCGRDTVIFYFLTCAPLSAVFAP